MSLRKGSNLIAGTQDVAQQLIATGSEGSANPVSSVAVNAALSVRDAEIAELGEVKVPMIGKGINLLDDWYFIGGGTGENFPINQRGVSSYPNQGYTVDRWYLQKSSPYSAAVSVQSNCVRVTNPADSSFANFIQPILASDFRGKTVTLSMLANVSSGKAYARIVVDTQAIGRSANYTLDEHAEITNGFATLTVTIPDSANSVYIQATVELQGSTADTVDIYAVKLELGSQQTLARNIGTEANPQWVLNDTPPNYQQELAKCQRYYFNSGSSAPGAFVAVAQNASFLFGEFRFPVKMRAIPTLNIKDYASTTGCVSIWNASQNGISVSPNTATLNHYGFNALGGTFTVGAVYAFQVEASAEL